MTRSFCLFTIMAVAACDSAVDGDHRGEMLPTMVDGDHGGEMLATIQGSLTKASAARPEPRVAIGWINKIHMSWLVGGQFPDTDVGLTSFTFDLFSPPADELMEMMPGGRFAMGLVALAPSDDAFNGPYRWSGFDHTRILLYLDEAPAPDSALYAWLNKPASISAGYHIFDIHQKTDAEYYAWLDCANTVPSPDMGMPSTYTLILACGPDGQSTLSLAPSDLDAQFDITSTEGMSELDVARLMPML